VGACIAVNKVLGVRACLIHESFSARQGVEDDDMNVICLGGRVVANMFAWKLVKEFLEAQFSGLERTGGGWLKSQAWNAEIQNDERIVKISPLAGKPVAASMLVNVPRLVSAYYTEVPDPSLPNNV